MTLELFRLAFIQQFEAECIFLASMCVSAMLMASSRSSPQAQNKLMPLPYNHITQWWSLAKFLEGQMGWGERR